MWIPHLARCSDVVVAFDSVRRIFRSFFFFYFSIFIRSLWPCSDCMEADKNDSRPVSVCVCLDSMKPVDNVTQWQTQQITKKKKKKRNDLLLNFNFPISRDFPHILAFSISVRARIFVCCVEAVLLLFEIYTCAVCCVLFAVQCGTHQISACWWNKFVKHARYCETNDKCNLCSFHFSFIRQSSHLREIVCFGHDISCALASLISPKACHIYRLNDIPRGDSKHGNEVNACTWRGVRCAKPSSSWQQPRIISKHTWVASFAVPFLWLRTPVPTPNGKFNSFFPFSRCITWMLST